ncbi:MAG: DUF4190 domain-containing protein [Acidobacteriota bacterium]
MFCTRCGTQNSDDAAFCRSCSSPLTKPVTQPRQPGTAPPSPPYATPGSSQSSPGHPSSSHLPYPGYQGYPVYQSGYANQPANQQGGASGRAIASLVLSIIGLLGCTFFTSIPGMILGKMEMNAIKEGKAPQAGEAIAKVGFYVGIAATVIYALAVLSFIMLFLIGVASSH